MRRLRPLQYRVGQITELLSCQYIGIEGSEARLIGSISKFYISQIKSNVFLMDRSSNCKLTLSKAGKQSLNLKLPYLVLQVYVPRGKVFGVEVYLTDSLKVLKGSNGR
jgi:hypothetical protein